MSRMHWTTPSRRCARRGYLRSGGRHSYILVHSPCGACGSAPEKNESIYLFIQWPDECMDDRVHMFDDASLLHVRAYRPERPIRPSSLAQLPSGAGIAPVSRR
jgi:hypothetical protein